MEIKGIKFAPLNVPFERRIQTLATALWFITFALGGIFCLIITAYLVLFTKLSWITLAYLAWAYFADIDTPKYGGRPMSWMRTLSWWKYVRDYFPLRFERLPWVELDPKRNYLFCCFPHGILPSGSFNAFGSHYGGFDGLFPHHEPRVVTLSQHFVMPMFRELVLGLGGIAADAPSIEYVLSHPGGGRVVVLVPGGAAETFHCKPGDYRLVIKNRKGFIKLALKHGTPLVPVFSFGETDLFDQLGSEGSKFRQIQERIRKWIGLAPAVPIGRGFFQYSFGLIPRRKPVTTVVGQPLDVPKIKQPTKEQIEEYHSKFLDCLHKMFEEQKHNYLENAENVKLIFD